MVNPLILIIKGWFERNGIVMNPLKIEIKGTTKFYF